MQPRFLIRRARPGDATLLARVHTDSWRDSHREIIPLDSLNQMTYESQERQWNVWLSPGSPELAYIAVDELGHIVGFALGGSSKTPDLGYEGELFGTYLQPTVQRTGLGRRLLHALSQSMDFYGFRSMMLWVLEDSAAVNFYRRNGGRIVERRSVRIGNRELPELCLGFDQLPLPRRFERITLGKGYCLDLVQATDKEAHVENFKDREIYERTLHIPWPHTISDAESYLAVVLGQRISHERDYTFVIREGSGVLVGGLGFSGAHLDTSHVAELSFWLARTHRGQGLGSRVVAAACELAERQYRMTRLSARVFKWNTPSQRVLEKNGFTLEGTLRKAVAKDGILHDEKIYARLARK